MTPPPPQGNRTYLPPCGKIQGVSPQRISGIGSETPLQIWKVDSDRVHIKVYVEHQGDSTRIGVDHPGINPQGKYRDLMDRSHGDTLKVHGGHHQYPPLGQHPVSRCPPQVPCRERHEGGHHGYQDNPGTFQRQPRPPITSLPIPGEGLQPGRLRPPHQDLGRLRCGATYVRST